MSSHHTHGWDGTRHALFGVRMQETEQVVNVRSAAASTTISGSIIGNLAVKVGGLDALECLDAGPFADEAFEWEGVDVEHHSLVATILAAMDDALGAACPPVEPLKLETFSIESMRRHMQSRVDVEYRTITRRLLARIARAAPALLARAAAVETAAALVWLALHGNDEFRRQRVLQASNIWHLFGVETCSRRGRALYRSLGLPEPQRDIDHYRGATPLLDAALMHSKTRRELVRLRDHFLAEEANEHRRSRESQPLQQLPSGDLRIAARRVTPRWAMRTRNDGERSAVVVTFGEHEDKPEVLALTVPDARHLISMIENALAIPFVRAQ